MLYSYYEKLEYFEKQKYMTNNILFTFVDLLLENVI